MLRADFRTPNVSCRVCPGFPALPDQARGKSCHLPWRQVSARLSLAGGNSGALVLFWCHHPVLNQLNQISKRGALFLMLSSGGGGLGQPC